MRSHWMLRYHYCYRKYLRRYQHCCISIPKEISVVYVAVAPLETGWVSCQWNQCVYHYVAAWSLQHLSTLHNDARKGCHLHKHKLSWSSRQCVWYEHENTLWRSSHLNGWQWKLWAECYVIGILQGKISETELKGPRYMHVCVCNYVLPL
jgi:hypothetical protein